MHYTYVDICKIDKNQRKHKDDYTVRKSEQYNKKDLITKKAFQISSINSQGNNSMTMGQCLMVKLYIHENWCSNKTIKSGHLR